jgi:hypothetical protein
VAELTDAQTRAIGLCRRLDMWLTAEHLRNKWEAGQSGYVDDRAIPRGQDGRELVKLVKQGNADARKGH